MYDVAIIGAGPAGLFAAYELAEQNKKSKKKLKIALIDIGPGVKKRTCPMIEQGMNCYSCKICQIMNGVGGAGLFSDGKLNLSYKHGKTNLLEFLEAKKANEVIDKIDNILIKYGAPKKAYNDKNSEQVELRDEAKKFDINLLLVKQKHIGSDNLPDVIKKMTDELENSGVDLLLNTVVEDIVVEKKQYNHLKLSDGKKINSKFLISCPGRTGASWMQKQATKTGIHLKHRGIEIGVRVEVKAKIMDRITKIMWDPPFFIKDAFTTDTVRTFCTNPNGFVVSEGYHGFNCVNGYAMKNKKSKNTNFALLADIELTHPAEDTISYGKSIGKLSSTIGGGRPFIQRLIDLKNHRRSYWKRIRQSNVKPTLKDVTPGDLSLALPGRVVNDLLNALVKLDHIAPGLNDDVLLYGPELKFFSVRLLTNKKLETNIKNLFVAGDGVGVAGNIVGAAATGIIAARGVLDKI